MVRLRPAEKALASALTHRTTPYICHTCRVTAAQQQRRLRTVTTGDSAARGEDGLFKRMRKFLLPDKKTEEVQERQSELEGKRIKEYAKGPETYGKELERVEVNGREVFMADIVDPQRHDDYKAVERWDGLRRVGGKLFVKTLRDEGYKYRGFHPQHEVDLTESQWDNLLHSVAVEVLALKEAGRDLDQVCMGNHGADSWARVHSVKIETKDRAAEPTLSYPNNDIKESILKAIPPIFERMPPKGNLQEVISSGVLSNEDGQKLDTWMDMRLSDPKVKLAIFKRITHLTGRRFPDPVISDSETIEDLRQEVQTRFDDGGIKKLGDSPSFIMTHDAIPNVSMRTRRVSKIDKDVEVGRYKLIEQELTRRDLPVRGTRWKTAKVKVSKN